MIYAIYANYIVYTIEYDTSIYNAQMRRLCQTRNLLQRRLVKLRRMSKNQAPTICSNTCIILYFSYDETRSICVSLFLGAWICVS